eukprot:3595481-Prymnesium_polylepis.1
MDVEGAEFDLIAGLRERGLLASLLPLIDVFAWECHPAKGNCSRAAGILKAAGVRATAYVDVLDAALPQRVERSWRCDMRSPACAHANVSVTGSAQGCRGSCNLPEQRSNVKPVFCLYGQHYVISRATHAYGTRCALRLYWSLCVVAQAARPHHRSGGC